MSGPGRHRVEGIAALGFLLAGFLQAQGGGAGKTLEPVRFENGFEILFDPVPEAEAMGLFFFVEGGWAEDPAGKTGLSHLVEHLVFTGATPSRMPGWPYERWVEERPLGANARTRPRYTVYFSIGRRDRCSADARRFAEVLAGRLEFKGEDLDREKLRVLSEVKNMTGYVPGRVLQWRARALLRGGDPEGRTGIGLADEVMELDLPDCRKLLLRTHRVERVLCVAVGAVDPKADLPFYREVFGSLERGKGRERPASRPAGKAPEIDPIQTHPNVGAVFATLAFRAPDPSSPDFPAFLLGAFWLMQRAHLHFGVGAREARAMFQPALYPLLEGPDLLFLNRRGGEEQAARELEAELRGFVKKSLGVSLNRAALAFSRRALGNLLDPLPRPPRRERLLARQPRLLSRPGLSRGVARLLGFPEDLPGRLSGIQPEAVHEALRRYLDPERGLFLALVPPKK